MFYLKSLEGPKVVEATPVVKSSALKGGKVRVSILRAIFRAVWSDLLNRLTSEKNYFTEGRNDASKKEDRKEEKSEGFGDSRLRDDPDGTLGDPSTGAPAYHEIAPLV